MKDKYRIKDLYKIPNKYVAADLLNIIGYYVEDIDQALSDYYILIDSYERVCKGKNEFKYYCQFKVDKNSCLIETLLFKKVMSNGDSKEV